jgi:hypothetical protein
MATSCLSGSKGRTRHRGSPLAFDAEEVNGAALAIPIRVARFTLLGVGAMRSPRYAPAGLLVESGRDSVMIDGGPGAAPATTIDAWLVTDAHAELIREIRGLARRFELEPAVDSYVGASGLRIAPLPVVHTSHPSFGYRIEIEGARVAWTPEFFEFPAWTRGFDLMFTDAAGYSRPIRFAGGVGGHDCVLSIAESAKRRRVRRLVFAHIGRPTIRAMDEGKEPPFGEFGHDGQAFELPASAKRTSSVRRERARSRSSCWDARRRSA